MDTQNPQRYVPIGEFMDMVKHINEAIFALSEATNALRIVTLLTASAIARQPNIDSQQFVSDVAGLIEAKYPQEDMIPMPVLDFHAELARNLSTKG